MTLLLDALPPDIRTSLRGVLWNREVRDGKPTKVPYQAHHPALRAAVDDPGTWAPLVDAIAAYEDGKGDGAGVVLGDGLVGVDLDGCRDPLTGAITGEAQAIIDALDSYTEISPSGTGVHILLRGALPPGGRRKGKVEMYAEGRYFTVTGLHLAGTPRTVEHRSVELAALHARLFGTNGNGDRHPVPPAIEPTPDDGELLDRARAAANGAKFSALLAGDTTGYPSPSEADQAFVNMLAFWTGGDAGRMDRLFRQSGLMREKWDRRCGRETYGQRTIATAIAGCRDFYTPRPPMPAARTSTRPRDAQSPAVDDDDEPVVLDPGDPLPSARALVARSHADGEQLSLRHQAGVFYAHQRDVSAYRELDELAMRAEVYAFLEPAKARSESKGLPALVPFKPTKPKVENVLDALRAVCNLPAARTAPCWLDDDPSLDPFDILPGPHGLLHIPTRRVYPATPAFFTLQGLDFAYEPAAPLPARWLNFLADLWPDDPASRDTLQEWLGYLLTPRTHLQKILMLVGPKRSGKGTIGRVARRLLGDRHVCSPTLANLGEPFGRHVLVGKSVAIIADARISGRTDAAVVAETLLSISGEDLQTIPRKYLPDWNGKLPTRFLVMTNELPHIEDASGALASRFIVLTLSRSFYGQEDHQLYDRFLPELPGILNWALEGWDRLYQRGRFLQPSSATDLIQEFEDLGSPIGAFIRERCDVGAGYSIPKDRLFQAWKAWCAENGRDRPGTVQTFGRNLRAALPWLGETQPRVLGSRVRFCEGIRLKSESEGDA